MNGHAMVERVVLSPEDQREVMWQTLFGKPSAEDLARGERHGLVDIVRNHDFQIQEARKDVRSIKKLGVWMLVFIGIQVLHTVGPDVWKIVLKILSGF